VLNKERVLINEKAYYAILSIILALLILPAQHGGGPHPTAGPHRRGPGGPKEADGQFCLWLKAAVHEPVYLTEIIRGQFQYVHAATDLLGSYGGSITAILQELGYHPGREILDVPLRMILTS
jgi:hypothetical protein